METEIKTYKRLSLNERFYFSGKPCKYGHIANRYTCNGECVVCRKEKNVLLKDKQDAWAIKNKEQKNAKSRFFYKENIDKQRERSRLKWKLNKEKVKQTNKAWANKNPGIWTFYGAKRRASIRKRTPKWADIKKIKEIYKNCPDGMVVDHIIPLRGKEVSGFHVENNLQYLTPEENAKKFNKLEKQYVYA
jgi:5-methylcytosine-specific restriction endonuclease McrA